MELENQYEQLNPKEFMHIFRDPLWYIKLEDLSKDEYVGWHAGNWGINTRSIAIAFVEDLSEKSPSATALGSAREIIDAYPNAKILGHNEIVKTICPSKQFLAENGWKQKLI